MYLVEKKGYDKESLRAFKSLQGYRLNADGHVEELSYHLKEGGGGDIAFSSLVSSQQENEKLKMGRQFIVAGL